jgi:hypothetical protein
MAITTNLRDWHDGCNAHGRGQRTVPQDKEQGEERDKTIGCLRPTPGSLHHDEQAMRMGLVPFSIVPHQG